MKDAIGYLRVSTSEQGRSGLGLAAKRHDIESFGSREGFSVKSWHQDIQTSAGKDALLLRPGLAEALKGAHAARCPLIVSRLDPPIAKRAFHHRAQGAQGSFCRRSAG
jgi:DNA invertase Pin-like site-specific DNA recombinase